MGWQDKSERQPNKERSIIPGMVSAGIFCSIAGGIIPNILHTTLGVTPELASGIVTIGFITLSALSTLSFSKGDTHIGGPLLAGTALGAATSIFVTL